MNHLTSNLKNSTKLPLLFILSFCLSLTMVNNLKAATPETAPRELTEVITKINTANNNKDLETLKQYIAPTFKPKDGLEYQSLTQFLPKFWENYPNLKYETKLLSWEQKGNQLLAETQTQITGKYQQDERELTFNSTIVSLQTFENGKLVNQEILQERTDLTSGPNPPEVLVQLPEKVRGGQQFNFDVILQEPLGTDLVLGAALQDKIRPELYTQPSEFELQELSSGGIFKLVTAPATEGDLFLSAMLVKADGLRIVTQRVKKN
jgi:hypothetical protein